MSEPIRVLALMESAFVTGPAKNLIEFARRAANPPGGPPVDLKIATYLRAGESPNAFVQAAESAGLKVYILREARRWDTRPVADIRGLVGELQPDLVQSHNTKSHLFVKLAGVPGRVPWIAFNHGYTATNLMDRVYNHVDRFTLPQAHRVIAVCRPFADRLMRRGVAPERIRIQHNSVVPFQRPPEEEIEAVRDSLALGGGNVVLAVGRLSSEKGHADLLYAVRDLAPPVRRDLRVVFAGDGPELPRLRQLAARLGLAETVVFAGLRKDVRPFYAAATVLALPSHTEGSPNVVLEAMAARVPIAATAVGGVPEILTDQQTGLIVPPRDPAAMSAALARLLGDAELRAGMAAAAAERVESSFTPEAYRQSMIAHYRDAIATFRPRSP
ncbi:MAG: glycosyltransferase [Bryobacteraceae bacterium]|nr:glycosyltransferase [Bryobacteraceae bacterium]